MLVLGVILYIFAPQLLEKRLNSKENQGTQKWVVSLLSALFAGGFILAGLDFRYGWSSIPQTVVVIFAVAFLVSYALYGEVMRENAYLSRTVEVQRGQKVVDTGVYSVVRHPMYAATVLMFLSIPIVLGSWWALIVFLPYPVLIAVRIIDEEKLLEKELDGYVEYMKKVKYRLIPFIW